MTVYHWDVIDAKVNVNVKVGDWVWVKNHRHWCKVTGVIGMGGVAHSFLHEGDTKIDDTRDIIEIADTFRAAILEADKSRVCELV